MRFLYLGISLLIFVVKPIIAAPLELKSPPPTIISPSPSTTPIPAPVVSPSPSPTPSLSPTAPIQEISLDHIEKGRVFFKAPPKETTPPPFETAFSSLQPVGTLRSQKSKIPYFLLEGKGCPDCSEVSQLVLIRPFTTRPSTFVYPGVIRALQTHQPVLQSRAFFGKCHPDYEEAYMVLSTEHVERKRRHSKRMETNVTTLILEMEENYPKEHVISHKNANHQKAFLNKILTQVRAKPSLCIELTGQDRTVMRKPFDLKTRDDAEDDDEDEEDPKVKVDETASSGAKPE